MKEPGMKYSVTEHKKNVDLATIWTLYEVRAKNLSKKQKDNLVEILYSMSITIAIEEANEHIIRHDGRNITVIHYDSKDGNEAATVEGVED